MMIQLYFEEYPGSGPELGKVHVAWSTDGSPLTSIRGRESPMDPEDGAFAWSNAVKALCELILKAKFDSEAATNKKKRMATITGTKGSSASSLDYAISKQPRWIIDMFGKDSNGTSKIRRLIKRHNPEGKRLGPITLSWNFVACPPERIEVFLNNQKLTSPDRLVGLWRLEGETEQSFDEFTHAMKRPKNKSKLKIRGRELNGGLSVALSSILTLAKYVSVAEPVTSHSKNSSDTGTTDSETYRINFKNICDTQTFLDSLSLGLAAQEVADKRITWQMHYPIRPILRPGIVCRELTINSNGNPKKVALVGRHPWNEWAESFYLKLGADCWIQSQGAADHDFVIIGDVVISLFIPPDIKGLINKKLSLCKNPSDLDLVNFYNQVVSQPCSSYAQITESPSLADRLYNNTIIGRPA